MNIENIIKNDPLVAAMGECKEIYWENENVKSQLENNIVDIDEAEARLARFAPFIRRMIPEVETGIIESELKEISNMKEKMGVDVKGRLFLKCDSHLPISGSIKARGGIYEVLKLAEKIAIDIISTSKSIYLQVIMTNSKST